MGRRLDHLHPLAEQGPLVLLDPMAGVGDHLVDAPPDRRRQALRAGQRENGVVCAPDDADRTRVALQRRDRPFAAEAAGGAGDEPDLFGKGRFSGNSFL